MLDQKITQFLFSLKFTIRLPKGVQVLDVYSDPEVQHACRQFYSTYYPDNNKRILLLGINPGRFGSGITGIPFTDPVNLEQHCNIRNQWKKQAELSSAFIYEMINAFGSVSAFYQQFYISSVSPLGFVKGNKNLNYYDNPLLVKRIEPFVVSCIRQQLSFGLHTDCCFCIGEGENFKYLQRINEQYGFFKKITSLPHPRYIMQYKRKQKDEFIQQYIRLLSDH